MTAESGPMAAMAGAPPETKVFRHASHLFGIDRRDLVQQVGIIDRRPEQHDLARERVAAPRNGFPRHDKRCAKLRLGALELIRADRCGKLRELGCRHVSISFACAAEVPA